MAKYRYTYFIQAYDKEGREIGRPSLRGTAACARMEARYRAIPNKFIYDVYAYSVRVTRRRNGTYTDEPFMLVWFNEITGQPQVSKRKEDLVK